MVFPKKMLLLLTCGLAACGGTDPEGPSPDAGTTHETPDSGAVVETPDAGPADTGPRVAQFGHDDTRTIVEQGSRTDRLNRPRDLAFNPERANELWVVNQATHSTTLFFNAGTAEHRSEYRADVSGAHFMASVSSIAFGADSTFATCQESTNGGNGFMGPTLWPSDLDIYARVNQTPPITEETNGSHLDMLHQSPLCMGIAHLEDNAYFVFDGQNGHVVYYDFQEDHGPGASDHSDGIVRRYVEAEVSRVAGVPGHMIIDKPHDFLYVADTGNARILRLDVRSGRVIRSMNPRYEPLEEMSMMGEVWVEVFVDQGLQQPSGIALHNGVLFVSDHETAQIIAFNLEGEEIERIDTGAQSLMGITVNPTDGRLWFVDAVAHKLFVINP